MSTKTSEQNVVVNCIKAGALIQRSEKLDKDRYCQRRKEDGDTKQKTIDGLKPESFISK